MNMHDVYKTRLDALLKRVSADPDSKDAIRDASDLLTDILADSTHTDAYDDTISCCILDLIGGNAYSATMDLYNIARGRTHRGRIDIMDRADKRDRFYDFISRLGSDVRMSGRGLGTSTMTAYGPAGKVVLDIAYRLAGYGSLLVTDNIVRGVSRAILG